MKDIKKYLKEIGYSKQDLANELNLSRPTLDTYIDLFERNKPIPKVRYQIAFNRLFNRNLSIEDFQKAVYSLKELIERDKRLGTRRLDMSAKDYILRLRKRMETDMIQGEWNKSVYSFMDTLISNYRHDIVLKKMAEFSEFLNGYIHEYRLKDEDKTLFAFFYKVLDQISSKNLDFDEEAYTKLVARRKDIIEERRLQSENYKEQINKAIQNTIEEMERKGLKATKEEMVDIVLKKIRTIEV